VLKWSSLSLVVIARGRRTAIPRKFKRGEMVVKLANPERRACVTLCQHGLRQRKIPLGADDEAVPSMAQTA
jgi:hypothetical protein